MNDRSARVKPESAASHLPTRPASSARSVFAERAGLLGALLLLILVFGSLSSSFFSTRTLISIANQIPDLTVIAVGLTLVLISGGIDLSVGSVLALCSAVLGVTMVGGGLSLGSAAAIALAAGAVCGMVSGSITVLAGLPSFIVTLGMLEVARGGAYLITASQTKYIGSSVETMATSLPILKISPSFLVAVAVVVIAQVVLTRTVFGRYLIAIGTNENAVRMSGIDTRPYRIAVFVISGLLCGLGAIMQTARLATADPNAAIGLELAAIAAAVIGGTSLMGGRGSVVNTFFGVLIIAVLQTGLASVGASEPIKRVITGSVIVVAALLDVWRSHWQRRSKGDG
jgi:ribose transport system permease protein|tara:strand:- start:5592 stop:6617 length:1026 start_codon:yes stop_codon:yes gene_type:complete